VDGVYDRVAVAYIYRCLCDTQELNMDDNDKDLCNVPVGCTWNYTLKPVEQAFAKQGGFMAAWDTTGGAGKKAFAHYESATEFVDALMLNRADQRFAYEVIPHGQPARAYFDIEWTSATLETGHQTLIKLLAYLDARIAAAYPGASRACLVACASRPLNKLVKMSYHVVYLHLVFGSNSDGLLKRLATIEDVQVSNSFPKSYITRHALAPFLPV